jgi:hypothetical protein
MEFLVGFLDDGHQVAVVQLDGDFDAVLLADLPTLLPAMPPMAAPATVPTGVLPPSMVTLRTDSTTPWRTVISWRVLLRP